MFGQPAHGGPHSWCKVLTQTVFSLPKSFVNLPPKSADNLRADSLHA
jgi:hypothetical protein